ncbi:uncharacterized protein LOC113359308 [Papaver somniferum]|uniref:uncharacterized protein LOC113359308 n=1 Tax=Papaver somniferum TaxID=3469 RepID=UPI000E6F5D48|nr:uncharacterized protein LOC113359308 [Papaver somniferum]
MVNAFGYDRKADYKLIIMNGYDGTLDVYTLGINSPKLIVVVDFSNEKCGELQLPEELLQMNHLRMTIGVLEGRLGVFVTVFEVCFKVWVMQDYGVQESWIQCYAFARELITKDYALKFMSTFRNGQILLKTVYELFLYDPKHSSGRKHRISSCLRLLDAVEYVESLVSLNSGT